MSASGHTVIVTATYVGDHGQVEYAGDTRFVNARLLRSNKGADVASGQLDCTFDTVRLFAVSLSNDELHSVLRQYLYGGPKKKAICFFKTVTVTLKVVKKNSIIFGM